MVLFLFLIALFLPTLQSSLGNSGAIFVNSAIFFVAVAYLLSRLGFPPSAFSLSGEQKIIIIGFGLLFATIPISMMTGLLFSGINLSIRDFFELHRPMFYCAIFLAGVFSARQHPFDPTFLRVIYFSFWVAITIGFLQIFWGNSSFFGLYTKAANIAKGRMAAPFINPYDFAFFLSFYCCLFVSFFGLVRERRLTGFLMLIIALFGILLTQSRSVFVGAIFSVVFLVPILAFLMSKKSYFIIKKYILRFTLMSVLSVLLLISSFLYLADSFPYLVYSLLAFVSEGKIGTSANLRVIQLNFAIEKAAGNPLTFFFGNGPAKDEMPIVESMYTYLFYRYGFLGLTSYLSIFIALPMVVAARGFAASCSSITEKALFLAFAAWCVSMGIMFLGNNFTEQTRLYFFYFFLVGYITELSISRRHLSIPT